jgi:hypothetical protein
MMYVKYISHSHLCQAADLMGLRLRRGADRLFLRSKERSQAVAAWQLKNYMSPISLDLAPGSQPW